MPIDFRCPHCQNAFKLGDHLVGKKLRCTKCSHPFVVPPPLPEFGETSEADDLPTFSPTPLKPRGYVRREPKRDESRDRPRPRSRRRDPDADAESQWLVPALIFGGVGAVALIVVVACIVLVRSPAPDLVADVDVQPNAPQQQPAFEKPEQQQPAQQPWKQPQPVAKNKLGTSTQVFLDNNGIYREDNVIRLGIPHKVDGVDWHGKLYAVDLKAGEVYCITLDSRDFDAYLFVFDQAGTIIAEDDDSGGELNSRIVIRPALAGRYRILATSLEGRGTGRYSFAITPNGVKAPPVVADNKNAAARFVKLGPPGTYRDDGLIRQGASIRVDNRNVMGKSYLVELKADEEYRIAMNSQQLDSYLYLLDGAGQVLARDDDGGGNGNALITYRPQRTAIYRIVATTFTRQQTGPFTLTITRSRANGM